MSTNEAAERLRRSMAGSEGEQVLDEALIRERALGYGDGRRATVERIRERLNLTDKGQTLNPFDVDAILDEVAARDDGR